MAETTNSGASIGNQVVVTVALFAIFLVAFLFLRPKFKNVYQKRVYASTTTEKDRPRPLAPGIFSWFKDLITRPDHEIIAAAGLDGYFFLRYMRLIVYICLVGIIITFPILLPVNATGGAGKTAFDLLSFGNIQTPEKKNRYYAHVFVGWVFFGFVLFTLYREVLFYASVRQAVLTSPLYSTLVSSRTVLFQELPSELMNPESIASMLHGVKYVFINKDASKLEKKVQERDKLVNKIEGAVVGYLSKAVKNRLKNEKKNKSPAIEGDDISAYVPDKKRPKYRLKPIIGKKVDTLEYGSTKVESLNSEIRDMQARVGENKTLNSVFVTFHTQEQAEIALQTLAHHKALHMAPRYIGVRPSEVVWANMSLGWFQRAVRSVAVTAFITALVIFWAIPVAFVGFLSNIDNLIAMPGLGWLSFLNNMPEIIKGTVTALLPTILLAVLMMLLPIILRKCAKIAGAPSTTMVEYHLQQSYFAFQVVQVFFVTTVSSSVASSLAAIQSNPASALDMLRENVPAASNFYISYFLLQGFPVSSGALLQIVAVLLYILLGAILDNSPRKKWSRRNIIGGPGWGTIFPVYTNLAVIALTYTLIQPLMLAFAAILFGLVYIAFLHNLMFVQKQTDGRGIFYCRALYQTFTGIYLCEVCMIALFVFAKNWGCVVLQAVLIGVTIFVQINLQNAYRPLQYMLPLSLTHETDELGRKGSGNLEKERTYVTGESSTASAGSPSGAEKALGRIPAGGAMARYFTPWKFLTPEVLFQTLLRAPIFQEPPVVLPDEVESTAYAHPSVTAENPVVWVPRDPWGLSTHQVEFLRNKDVNATDEGAWFEIDDNKKKTQYAWAPQIENIPVYTAPYKF